ncbi:MULTISPECIES: glucosamine-6-phosphate deaminase [unclassified Arthrobacter]|uniref:glucosamine-6-phosphate deaminase n=1 Tax=unclassified Arthrobacter TaxID=235627 RepID=UPI001E405804|nr:MULTISPECIES: glucosamine-6-phosphate deaminase [unclassified Arthrobacter]MCC9145853.1 glucosamine-6-phosphate deaminase [Arthrobacter sp. zg-Y919]MDK1277082.1 glucosamine-6-phosphate deaminase [Arthrobacter sp. zg.Y919]WIB03607.1 glucosamine-6-phosphate deaminase [Arthrobacter sp. zg-Y919]
MHVVILETPAGVGDYAAREILRSVDAGQIRNLGVATGSSPLSLYKVLERHRSSRLAALDEYVGLAPEHPESYHAVIHREVTQRLGLDPENVHVPDGSATDLAAACTAFEAAIRAAGGIDLQILGIGRNGHIGFNEPTSSLASRTRVKTLMSATRRDNARFFSDASCVPTHCVTQGLGTILEARRVILVAQGAAKAAAVASAVEGPLAGMCPASVLQLHPDAVFVLDREAARDLTLQEYYRNVQEHGIP